MVTGLHHKTKHSENPSLVSEWNNFLTRLYLSHDKTPNYYRSFGNRKITKKENCTNISLLIFSYLSALNLDSFFTGVVCWSWENSLFIMYSLNSQMSSNGPNGMNFSQFGSQTKQSNLWNCPYHHKLELKHLMTTWKGQKKPPLSYPPQSRSITDPLCSS
jgi:hypothetical protein